MQHRVWGPARVGLLAIVVGLAACRVPGGVTGEPQPRTRSPLVKAAASKPPVASPSPSASTSTAPSASPSASASSAPRAPMPLQKPAGATRVLKGTVSIDAHYAASAGGGRIVGNNGGQAIAFGDASLIANNGSNVISDNGASLIGKVKAPIAGLVSNNGGALVSNNGGGLISDKGVGYRTLQAAAPALGEILPAAGLAIRVFSLRTGEILPIGADEAGKPVYEVYSDAQGRYTLYLPESAVDNVLLQAFVPEKVDKQLDLRLVVPEAEATQTVDVDGSLVTDLLRKALTNNMEVDLRIYAESATLEEAVAKDTEIYSNMFRDLIMQMRRKIFTAAEAAGVKSYSPERRRVLAQRITDAALSHLDLPAIQTNYARQKLTIPEEPAMEALKALMQENRESLRADMREQLAKGVDLAAYYAEDEIVKTVNAVTTPPFVIRNPAEAMDFFVFGLVVNPQMAHMDTGALLRRMEATPKYRMKPGTIDRMFGSIKPVEEAYVKTFFLDEKASSDALQAIAAGVP